MPWRSGCGPGFRTASVQGVRPNSVQMAISVESKSPRAFKSLIKRRDRAVHPQGLGAVVLHVAVGIPVVIRPGVDQLDHAHALARSGGGRPGTDIRTKSCRRRRPRTTASVVCSLAPGVEHLGRLSHHAPRPRRTWRSWREGRHCPGRTATCRSFTSRSIIRSSSWSETDCSCGRRSGIGSAPAQCARPGGSAAGNCCPTPGCRHRACARKEPCRTAATG